MKHIVKQSSLPTMLRTFDAWGKRRLANNTGLTGSRLWKGIHHKYAKILKSALQNTLLREQGYICAYCNRPIHAGTPLSG